MSSRSSALVVTNKNGLCAKVLCEDKAAASHGPIHPNNVSILKSCHVTQYSAAPLTCKYIDCFNLPSFNLESESVTG